MKLHTHYSIDECNDVDLLFERLTELQDENKIEFKKEDRFLIKVTDIDLSENEEIDLIKLLESLDLYPFLEFESDDYDIFEDEESDDYSGKGKSRKSQDDDYDY